MNMYKSNSGNSIVYVDYTTSNAIIPIFETTNNPTNAGISGQLNLYWIPPIFYADKDTDTLELDDLNKEESDLSL